MDYCKLSENVLIYTFSEERNEWCLPVGDARALLLDVVAMVSWADAKTLLWCCQWFFGGCSEPQLPMIFCSSV